MRIESTELFAGPPSEPRQIVRVTLTDGPGQVDVVVTGGATGSASGAGLVEVPVRTEAPVGSSVPITVHAGREVAHATLTVAEPGWTVYLVSHFHYDPVWWNTQAGYTSEWDSQPDAQEVRMSFQHTAFHLIDTHLELARRDPDYRFVLAEVDYLKPYWDSVPEHREIIRKLIADGRLEIMGGTYNEPNTNLTGAETTIRNVVYGMGFQRDILGGDPATAWQLDAFGHDPQFPGLIADAGLSSSSWARGPFHQWGPMLDVGTYGTPQGAPDGMQFRSEFEWISPSGKGLLTSYMVAHYTAGWSMDSADTLVAAEESVYRLFLRMKKVAATRNVLLPVGTDYSPPNKWVTAIHRDWNARYRWPRFVCALPRDFFAAVAAEGAVLSPQSRDMNPIYTGKDVSYIDTKQAQRAVENLLLDGEKFATLAALVADAPYPAAALDKAWRQLLFGAHHDAITGVESDQVYLDLLAGWREAYDLARTVHDTALRTIASHVDSAAPGVTVFNALAWPRTDVVRATVPGRFLGLVDDAGAAVHVVVERVGQGSTDIRFIAAGVPSIGYRTYLLSSDGVGATWRKRAGTTIDNEYHRLTVDPERGGAVASLVELATGVELITPGEVGNELVVYDEYQNHPGFGEGPWHLLPKGISVGSASVPAAAVVAEESLLGKRITVTGAVGPLTYTQTVTLWNGIDRVDCVTHIDTFEGSDQLVRLRWPCAVPGARPVSEVGHAVVGRAFAHPDVDVAQHPWTLDNPAHQWFGLSSTARISLGDHGFRAIGVAEIVVPREEDTAELGRAMSVALVRSGVTATCSYAEGDRYGLLSFDSNVPDVRIAVGGPDVNPFTAAVLSAAGVPDVPGVRWIPAAQQPGEAFRPDADLRGPTDLPVLVVPVDALAAVIADLADSRIEVPHAEPGTEEPLEHRSVAVLNRGIPGFAVDTAGRMHLSLMRSCTGWPSGLWIDPPRRTTPDGSGFQLQHWSHTFDYAIASGPGDWRDAGFVPRAHDFNHPLRAVVTRERHGGLPSSASLLRVEPVGSAVVAAVKPAGNPTATGQTAAADRGVTVRLYEPNGRPAQPRVTGWVPFTKAAAADLLEEEGDPATIVDGVLHADLGPSDVMTYVLQTDARPFRQQPWPEVAQPVFSRYWLHNRGAAASGNLPVSVHLRAHGERFRVSLASDIVDADVDGHVRIVVPDGWDADPSDRPIRLSPNGWTEFDLTVTPPSTVDAGPYPVAAQVEFGGQTFEDVVFVDQHGRPTPGPDASLLRVEVSDGVLLHNTAGFDIRGELAVISPWGTWDTIPVATYGFDIPVGRLVRVPFERPAASGSAWFLVKCMWFGRVSYSRAVPL